MNDQEIVGVVDQVLRNNLGAKGFEKADVASEADFDGGSIIRVIAHYRNGKIPSDDLVTSLHEIREKLLQRGEERFVILSSSYEGEQSDEGDEE
jgi:hypothetical protein